MTATSSIHVPHSTYRRVFATLSRIGIIGLVFGYVSYATINIQKEIKANGSYSQKSIESVNSHKIAHRLVRRGLTEVLLAKKEKTSVPCLAAKKEGIMFAGGNPPHAAVNNAHCHTRRDGPAVIFEKRVSLTQSTIAKYNM